MLKDLSLDFPTMATTAQVQLSAKAARQVRKLADAEGRAQAVLKLEVQGGGCSGFQYHFDLADAAAPDDHVFETDGVQLAIDPVSLPLLDGSVVDYVTALVGSSFQITNPNAASACGCGTSFSIG